MNQIITGAAAGILGDKTGEALYGKAHLEESHNQECLHADIHRIADCLESMLENPVSEMGTPRAVTAQVTPGVLLPDNQHRKGVSVFNASASTLYLGLFSNQLLTTSLYTTQIPPNTLYEMPTSPLYKGEISAIWASANGNALVTEMT
jgi:hypothetical protein